MFKSLKKIPSLLNLSKKAFGRYKFQIILLIVLGFLSGLFEGIGINALIPLLSFVVGEGNGGTDVISNIIRSAFDYFKIDFRLRNLLILVNILFVGKALVLLFFHWVKVKISEDYGFRVRQELFSKTLQSEWRYLSNQKVGYLENVIMEDTAQSSGLLKHIAMIIIVSASLLVYTVVAFNISSTITAFTIVLGLVVFLLFKPLAYKRKYLTFLLARLRKKIAHFVNQHIIGMKTTKTMFVTKPVLNISSGYFTDYKNMLITRNIYNDIIRNSMEPISLIFITVVFAFFYKQPQFDFAVLVAIIYLIQRMFTYFKQWQTNFNAIIQTAPHLSYVMKYLDQASRQPESRGGSRKFSFSDKLQFKDVSFGYKEGQSILSNLEFSIPKGKMIGLIGSSGAGKTTIVDIILRLLEPQQGKITLDGRDIKDISLEDWRRNIGYVSQDIFLLNDTFANNIRFYDDSITDKQIKEAARMANIYEVIKNADRGFETNIGERGMKISAGQRQRVVLARVLARQPKILILDEATSALDNESEEKIQKVIEGLKGKLTIFVIAHRLSTLTNVDELLVLDNGKIVEKGKPSELLKDKQSYFYKVFNIRR